MNAIVNKTEFFYRSGFSDYYLHLYCYIHNVLADVFSGFLQVFLIELRSQHGTSNQVLYLNHECSLTITGYKCKVLLYCYWPAART